MTKPSSDRFRFLNEKLTTSKDEVRHLPRHPEKLNSDDETASWGRVKGGRERLLN